MRSYPIPKDGLSLKDAKRTIASADSNGVKGLFFADALEVQTMSMWIDLPQIVGSVGPTLHILR